MSAQDEGKVPFDDLPKRQLKEFIEDVVDLNPGVALNAAIPPGLLVNTPTPTASTNDADRLFLREEGICVPSPKFHSSGIKTANADDVLFIRFVARENVTTSGVLVANLQDPTGTSKIDVGIYEATGTTLLTSSGPVAHAGVGSEFAPYTFTSPLVLSAGTEYVLAYLNDIDTGSWRFFSAILDGDLRQIYQTASTVAEFAANGWESRFFGTGWTSLQDNVAAAAAGAAHEDVPISLLTVV